LNTKTALGLFCQVVGDLFSCWNLNNKTSSAVGFNFSKFYMYLYTYVHTYVLVTSHFNLHIFILTLQVTNVENFDLYKNCCIWRYMTSGWNCSELHYQKDLEGIFSLRFKLLYSEYPRNSCSKSEGEWNSENGLYKQGSGNVSVTKCSHSKVFMATGFCAPRNKRVACRQEISSLCVRCSIVNSQ
jgi:hypothetical protein